MCWEHFAEGPQRCSKGSIVCEHGPAVARQPAMKDKEGQEGEEELEQEPFQSQDLI